MKDDLTRSDQVCAVSLCLNLDTYGGYLGVGWADLAITLCAAHWESDQECGVSLCLNLDTYGGYLGVGWADLAITLCAAHWEAAG